MLKIIPLGGLGEIGLNMMVFEYGTTLFIVDAGLMFPEDYMLGVDYVIPDMDYVKKNRSLITGVVLTHAHEDHIGALPFLLKEVDAPVFGTPFTLGVVRHKLEEHDLLPSSQLHEIHPGERLKLGPFELEFIQVGHSVVDGIGIAIKTPLGLIVHTGPAAVIRHERGPDGRVRGAGQEQIDRDFANITADHVIVGRYLGPIGAPGMPERGPVGLPTHLLRQGMRDMVRVVDCRMSGTSYGTIVLHVAPEAAVGGPLAIVEDGDLIELDANAGKLNLLVDEREIHRRLAAWRPPPPAYRVGYRSLWLDQVTQAPDGCDFRFNIDPEWRG